MWTNKPAGSFTGLYPNVVRKKKDVQHNVPSGFHSAVQEKTGMVPFITAQFFHDLTFCLSVIKENI
jgi:hypothetical protein